MVSKVTLIGRLGGDPEVRRLENGIAVAQFNVATNESYKDNMGNWQDRTEWHRVVAWRALAERAESTLKKGALVYVEGKISTRKWQDQNGVDRYSTDVVANYFRILSGRENSGNFPSPQDDPMNTGTSDAAPSENTTPSTNTTSETASTQPTVSDSADDDLPF